MDLDAAVATAADAATAVATRCVYTLKGPFTPNKT